MNATTAVAEHTTIEPPMLHAGPTSTGALVLSPESMDRMMAVAQIMATGKATVPEHLQRNPADCMAVIMQAMQWRVNPFAVAQKTHLVGGKLGYEAQLVNAVIQSMAPTKGRLQFKWEGDWEKIIGKFKEVESKTKKDDDGHFKKYRVPAWDLKDEAGLSVTVWATLKGEDEPRSLTLLMAQARTRNSTLWTDDPKQQLAYLATKRWARLYCPDVILGVYTRDELEEVEPRQEKDITPARTPQAIGEQARLKTEEKKPGEKAALIASLEGAKTLADLQEMWFKLSKEDRILVGGDELGRIKDALTKAVALPTADELMDKLIASNTDDEVQLLLSQCGHLPEQERAEFEAACALKLRGEA